MNINMLSQYVLISAFYLLFLGKVNTVSVAVSTLILERSCSNFTLVSRLERLKKLFIPTGGSYEKRCTLDVILATFIEMDRSWWLERITLPTIIFSSITHLQSPPEEANCRVCLVQILYICSQNDCGTGT